jgi:hypothetical protein
MVFQSCELDLVAQQTVVDVHGRQRTVFEVLTAAGVQAAAADLYVMMQPKPVCDLVVRGCWSELMVLASCFPSRQGRGRGRSNLASRSWDHIIPGYPSSPWVADQLSPCDVKLCSGQTKGFTPLTTDALDNVRIMLRQCAHTMVQHTLENAGSEAAQDQEQAICPQHEFVGCLGPMHFGEHDV